MLRKLLGVAATLALPAVLVAQTPKSSTAGAVRGKAMHFQGEVVRPADAVRTAGDVDHNQSDGAKAEDHKDAHEGPDVDEGPNDTKGPDVDEGPEAKDGPDVDEGPNAEEGHDVAEQAKGEQHEDESTDAAPAPAPHAGHNTRIGHHKP